MQVLEESDDGLIGGRAGERAREREVESGAEEQVGVGAGCRGRSRGWVAADEVRLVGGELYGEAR